jgi:RNA polymerase sigma-70 factor, ECF subfamily
MSDQRRADPTPEAVSFELLYRREFGKVVALAYVLSGSRSAAEELAQDAFMAAHRRWDVISGYDDPAAWVRRVCANRSTSLIRRRTSEAKALARLAGRRVLPEELPPDAAAFWEKVRKLPKRQAQVIALHYLDDLSVAQIAAILDCAEGTVKVHLHRGRKALAAGLHVTMDSGEEDE